MKEWFSRWADFQLFSIYTTKQIVTKQKKKKRENKKHQFLAYLDYKINFVYSCFPKQKPRALDDW